jgi:protein-S-isoprenylcysteine O-methyltransferase Ste14
MVGSPAIAMKRLLRICWGLVRVTVAVLFASWCALHLRRWEDYIGVSLPTWSRVPGLIVTTLGGSLVLLCGGLLSTRGILETPGDRWFPKEFVAWGPFRYVRNPMSLGWVIFMLGLGLYESSVLVILFAVALFSFLHAIVVFVEEPGLEKRFGESYLEYKRSVPRWLPQFGLPRFGGKGVN